MSLRTCKCLVALVVTLAAIANVHPAAGKAVSSSGGEILIGVSNSQSGPSMSLGKELIAGSKAYFDLVNAGDGIQGRHIRMIVKDDHYDPDPAVINTNDLITRNHVLFLFDYVGTSTLARVLPLLRFYETEQVVNVAPMTGAEPQRQPPYARYVFNIRASYKEEALALVEHLYARGCRRFGFLGQSDAYGKNGEVAVAQALSRHGLSIVSSVWYRRGAMFRDSSDLKQQVEMLQRSHVDAVIVFGVYGPCVRFIHDVRSAHWNVPIANVSFVDSDLLLANLRQRSKEMNADLTTNLINSEVVPSPYESSCRLVADFHRYVPPAIRGHISLEGWLNAAVAVEALRRSQSCASPAAFLAAMESLHDWDPGLGIPLHFSPQSHQALHTVWISASDNGRWVPVARLMNGRYEKHSH